MARRRPKTCPKTRSHRMGWTARVTSSVQSRRSLRASTSAMASVWSTNAAGGDGRSAEPLRGATGASDVTVVASLVQRSAGEVDEDVLERGALTHALLKHGGRARR